MTGTATYVDPTPAYAGSDPRNGARSYVVCALGRERHERRDISFSSRTDSVARSLENGRRFTRKSRGEHTQASILFFLILLHLLFFIYSQSNQSDQSNKHKLASAYMATSNAGWANHTSLIVAASGSPPSTNVHNKSSSCCSKATVEARP